MNILILGGSNAGIIDGWAYQFSRIASEIQVQNRFLGAVGSLYGLLALMKARHDGIPLPDVVIFEYCLNDILLYQANILNIRLLIDTLDAVIEFCQCERISLVFLNLRPLENPTSVNAKAIKKISWIYRSAAIKHNIRTLWQNDVLGGSQVAADYRDDNHFSSEASGRIANAIRIALNEGLPTVISGRLNASKFTYTEADQARVEGPVSSSRVCTKVFDGNFLEIRRGGKSFWSGQGYVAGIMLQTNEQSGDYTIQINNKSIRKRAFSQMQKAVPNLILLHYVKKPLWSSETVEISMPINEGDLLNLAIDRGIVEGVPTEAFQNQTLQIHALMFWTPRHALWKAKHKFLLMLESANIFRNFKLF